MKKLFLITALFCLAGILQAQKNPVDEMFDKYSETEGITTVYISSKMFSLFANKEKDDDAGNVASKLKSIRILTVEDKNLNKNLNFYKELGKKMDFSKYEDLMEVKEGSEMTKFLIRQDGDIISELLVIVGGPGENTLISIKGDLDMKTISEISRNSGIEGLENLERIEDPSENKE